ncbi:MAG: right-handed parallel beta-helix repeat-containing protein [Proteobacteria bacterium]|nr:right-handed parallel beta-helix repeat-containing protein [Pseudomonadota bacterium]
MKSNFRAFAPYVFAAISLGFSVDSLAESSACTDWIRPGMSLDFQKNKGDIEICVESGNYDQQLSIQGLRGGKVKIRSQYDDPLLRANFRGGVLIRNSSGITLSNVNVSRPKGNPATDPAAILIDQGSENNIIDNVMVRDSTHGIAIGGEAYDGQGGPSGAGNIIQNSRVERITLNGITVGNGSGLPVNASHLTAPFGTHISKNTITDSGGHGIDVDASRGVRIVDNVISSTGNTKELSPGGYSGIHLYSAADSGSCSSNQVFYNYVWGTGSIPGAKGTDGNGIQIDNFCDDNAVGYNVVWNNAGAGIAIFNAARNQVYSNTVAFNSQQPDRATTFDPRSSAVGEIILSACVDRNPDSRVNECAEGRPHDGRTQNNMVYNNIVFSSVQKAPAINVHETAVRNELDPTRDLMNKVGPNMLSTAGSIGDPAWPQLVYGKNSSFIVDQDIDKATGTSGNLIEIPFVVGYDARNLESVYLNNSFQLARRPSKIGEFFDERKYWRDIIGQNSLSGSSVYFGAYYNLKK